jgi:hypothetical protein
MTSDYDQPEGLEDAFFQWQPPRRPLARAGAPPSLVLLGALALGAAAIGALAIGALAIGRLTIGRARVRDLQIDNLRVRRVTGL